MQTCQAIVATRTHVGMSRPFWTVTSGDTCRWENCDVVPRHKATLGNDIVSNLNALCDRKMDCNIPPGRESDAGW